MRKIKRAGRRARFKNAGVSRSLNLPAAFWSVLDSRSGSRTDSFVKAMVIDVKLLARLRKTLAG